MSSGTDRAYMSAAEYAAHRGVSDSFVRRLRRQGKLVCDGSRIHVAESDRLLDNVQDPLRGGDRSAGAGGGAAPGAGRMRASDEMQDAVLRERMARAQLAELELGSAAGELTRADGVRTAVFTLARAALNQLQLMRVRLRERLVAAATVEEVDKLLNEEITEISKRMREAAAKLQADPGDAEAVDTQPAETEAAA